MTLSSTGGSAPADCSRRQFTTLLALGGLGGLSACGGGSDGTPTPPPPPAPPTAHTLSLVAGGLGGAGLLDGTGTEARMLGDFNRLAVNAAGDVFFTRYRYKGDDNPVSGCGFISRTGQLQHLSPPTAVSYDSWVVADAQGRFLISLPAEGGGWQLQRWDGSRFTPVTNVQGEPIRLVGFATPVLDGQGTVWFLDYDSQGRHPLRTLGADGQLRTVTDDSPDGTLVWDASGQLMLLESTIWTGAAWSPRRWFGLATSDAGQVAWQATGTQWRSSLDSVVAAVQDSPGLYWARSGVLPQVVQRRIDGTDVNVLPVPDGILKAVAMDARTHQWLLAVEPPYTTGGVVYRMDTQTGQTTVWCGAPEQRGIRSGSGAEAHFDLSVRAEAFADPTGDLYVASGLQNPMQRVSPDGNVALQAFPLGVGGGLARTADGDWVTASEPHRTLIQRARKDGSSNWQTWMDGYASTPHMAFIRAFRLDASGRLWFAQGTNPEVKGRFVWDPFAPSPVPPSGGNVLGLIEPSGQISIVVGTPDVPYQSSTYPDIDQRPWYFDITDFGLESAAVGWLLCNRTATTTRPTQPLRDNTPLLVRVEGSAIKTFALPDAYRYQSADTYTRLCLLPGRPGEVFLASHSAVFRWTEASGLTVLAGNPNFPTGVKLGALPAGLAEVKFLVPGPTAHSLYIGSENSVLRLDLPA